MVIYTFNCSTEGCENADINLRMGDVVNPTLCPACGKFTDAIEVKESK